MGTPLAGAKVKASNWSDAFPTNTDTSPAYAPTWTQSVTITHTVTTAQINKVGRWVDVNLNLNASGAGTASNPLTVTLPYNIRTGSGGSIGSFTFFDASAGISFAGSVTVSAVNAVQFQVSGVGGKVGTATGSFTAAVAAGDILSATIRYEASS